MKNKSLTGLIVAGWLISVAAVSVSAQNVPGQGRNGCGYGGPPATGEERAARQAACLEKNGGVCPNGGPRISCPGDGQGGRGKGLRARQGLRDGTGPRGANGNCPQGNLPQQPGR